jgi:ribose transport system substrate-binding protein
MPFRTSKAVALATAVALTATLAACAPTVASTSPTASSGDAAKVGHYTSSADVAASYSTKKVCGTKPITIGFAVGLYNAWMQQAVAMMKNELKKSGCDNVKFIITDDQDDPQKTISDIQSLGAQQVSGVLTFPLFGASEIPAMRKVNSSGIPVVAFITDGGAKVGTDIAASVTIDTSNQGSMFVDFFDRAVGTGTVVVLGGAPGQPNSTATMAAMVAAGKDHPNLKFVSEDFQPTSGDPTKVRSVMSGLLAKYGRIDAVAFDNGAVATPIVEAYEAAGMKPPAIALAAGTNSMSCAWEDASAKFPYFSTDGEQSVIFIALRKLLAKINDLPEPEPSFIAPFAFVDTTDNKNPTCVPEASPDADWSTTLSKAEIESIGK